MFLARKELRLLQDSCQTLNARVEELERQRKLDLLEMDSIYEKVHTMVARVAKREQRASQEGGNGEPEEAPCPDPITARVRAFREARRDVLSEP